MKKAMMFFCVLFLLFVLAACDSTTTKTGGSTVPKPTKTPDAPALVGSFKISAYKDYESDQSLDDYVQEIMLMYPGIAVTVDDEMSKDEYFATLDERVKNGTIGDVFVVDDTRVGSYAESGYILPVTSYLTDLMNYETYERLKPEELLLPQAYKAAYYNNEMYMCPMEYDHELVLMNYDMINEARDLSVTQAQIDFDDFVTYIRNNVNVLDNLNDANDYFSEKLENKFSLSVADKDWLSISVVLKEAIAEEANYSNLTNNIENTLLTDEITNQIYSIIGNKSIKAKFSASLASYLVKFNQDHAINSTYAMTNLQCSDLATIIVNKVLTDDNVLNAAKKSVNTAVSEINVKAFVNNLTQDSTEKLLNSIALKYTNELTGYFNKTAIENAIAGNSVIGKMLGANLVDSVYTDGILDQDASKKVLEVYIADQIAKNLNINENNQVNSYITNSNITLSYDVILANSLTKELTNLNDRINELEKIGIPSDKWTWNDFMVYVESLSKLADKNKSLGLSEITPLALDSSDYAIWGAFVNGFGGSIISEDGTSVSVNSDNSITGILTLGNLFTSGKAKDIDNVTAETLFNYGMIIISRSDLSEWYSVLENSDVAWDYMHFPRFNNHSVGVHISGLAVHKKVLEYEDAEDEYDLCANVVLYGLVETAAVKFSGIGEVVPASLKVYDKKFWREYPIAGKNTSAFASYYAADFSAALYTYMPQPAAEYVDDIGNLIDSYIAGGGEQALRIGITNIQNNANSLWQQYNATHTTAS